MVSFRIMHRTLVSISLPNHCPVIGEERNETKEATKSSEGNAEDKVVEQRKWEEEAGLEGLQRKSSLLNCSVSCKVPFSGSYYYYYHHNGHYHHHYRLWQ